MVGSALGIFAYVQSRADFSSYLFLPHIPGAGELAVICGAIAGAGLGFLARQQQRAARHQHALVEDHDPGGALERAAG